MPKLLQINPVLRMNTSTGRIMQEIGDVAMSAGWESFVAYSKGRDGMRESTSKTVPVGNRFSVAVHGLGTRKRTLTTITHGVHFSSKEPLNIMKTQGGTICGGLC